MADPTHSDLLVHLARIEGKVDGAIAVNEQRLASAESRLKDHEYRVRDVERWKWRSVGAGGIIGAISAAFISIMRSNS